MPVPLIVPAVSIGARVLSSVKNLSTLDKATLGALSTYGAYLGLDKLSNEFLSNAPSGNETVPLAKSSTAPASPVSSPDVKNPSSPAPSVPYMETAKQVNKSSAEKATTASTPSTVLTTGGLLGILKTASENSFQIEAAKTQILAEQLGFMNEQIGATLLYHDMIVNSLFEISATLSAISGLKTQEIELSPIASSIGSLTEVMASKEMGISAEAVSSISGAITSSSAKPELAQISKTLKPVAENSEKSLERQRFMTTPQVIKDLEGNTIARATPDQIKVSESATTAKYRTDVNNDSFDELDFPSLDSLPLVPFVGVASVFDKDNDISQNPFSIKNI
jgi:hypothetical protein